MNITFKKVIPHICIVIGFVIASLAYFSPVLSGKKIRQSDIVQYTGMAKQQTDFRNETGEEPYWTDSAFGGMPTYQLGAQYPNSYVKKIDRLIRFLPRPADYLFLYFIGFYILLLVLKVEYRLAFLGSLAFGLSTYFIIIIGVGHNAKAHAIGYMPLVLSGILMTFRKHYIWGFVVLALAMALEIAANHFQMTYYLMLLVLVIGIVYGIEAFRKKEIIPYAKAIGVMLVAVIFSVLLNATSLLATKEYAAFSTRGTTGLTITPEGKPKQSTGLDFEYITEYSYGKLESFNLLVPRFMGGASNENIGEDAEIYDALLAIGASHTQAKSYTENAPTYWGDQTIVGAPAYIGAALIFLFILGFFLVQGRAKWWLVSGSVFTLLLSWGKNFKFLTVFFIDYFPMYDKFRAVSSIQVIIELCVPILAILAVQQLLSGKITKEKILKAIYYTTGIVGGVLLLFLLFKTTLFDFRGANDAMFKEQLGQGFINALREDRKSIFSSDVLRSLFFVLSTAGLCWAYVQDKINKNILLLGLGLCIVIDLVGVDRNYVNTEGFVSAREFNTPFISNTANKKIAEDTGHYRVYDLTTNPFNSGRASYFHNALGGYHAAKPGRIQDLFDFYLAKGSFEVLNMFNVKYIIFEGEEGIGVQKNPDVNGSAWFVEQLKVVNTPNEEILELATLRTKKEAIINASFQKEVSKVNYIVDSLASIKLTAHQPNRLEYLSNSSEDGFAVFSEVYYENGWEAFIDGKPIPHVQVNYTLRGLQIPSGKHEIIFTFDPQVVKTGSAIIMSSAIVFVLLVGGALFYEYKKRQNEVIIES